ncbi:YheT family hydrolase [Psychrobacter sp. I-STPA10]|uniref:YheT family hydrolase n=1 Tax=Psychrobacter sp. I-STPA10 TaxID=2585769 RepID=UPI001E361A83|nr:alpha/beta fold hydrolase [Psychrobacter sp. I-STPA10]
MTTPIAFTPEPFKPPFWLSNPHLQTILPKFIMPEPPPYRRSLALDSRDESDIAYDFYDADEPTPAEGERYQTPLIVLFHGLEGSSKSHYARTLAYYVHAQGWHLVVAHFRSCGGMPARGKIFYEAGDTLEIHHTLQYLSKHYAHIHAVGTSLGGSVLAKYMGEYGDDAKCQSAAIVSAPLDLASSSIAMDRLFGRKIYTPYLLNPIVAKALEHHLSHDEIAGVKASRRLSDFDHVFTAPRHGYRSKNDYYHKASAMPFLHKISKPTLIITAKDDPFLGIVPDVGDISDNVVLCEPKHGGHIGFLTWHNKKFNTDWYPKTVMQFFTKYP